MSTPSKRNNVYNGNVFLVTGGTGFLGLHVVNLLLEAGAYVRLFSRSPPPPRSSLASRLGDQLEHVCGDVTKLSAITKAAQDTKGIFHLAAVVAHTREKAARKAMFNTNIVGTVNVIKAAQSNKCAVCYLSTSGVVGCSRVNNIVFDDAPYCKDVVSNWPYYHSKILAEERATTLASTLGVPLIVLRPSVMLGPGDTLLRSSSLLLSYLKGTLPIVPAGGYSFVDIRDVADVCFTAMSKMLEHYTTYSMSENNCKTYLLGSFSPTFSELFSLLEKMTGIPQPAHTIPVSILLAVVNALYAIKRNPHYDPVRVEMSACYWGIDPSRARSHLHFTPRDPETTLLDTLQWLVQYDDVNLPTPLRNAVLTTLDSYAAHFSPHSKFTSSFSPLPSSQSPSLISATATGDAFSNTKANDSITAGYVEEKYKAKL